VLAAGRSQVFHSHVWTGLDVWSRRHLTPLLTDARALVTAYYHAIADPRPELSQMAKVQGISPSSIRHRYTREQVEAIVLLLEGEVRFDLLLEPFSSFDDMILVGSFENYSEIVDKRMRLRQIYFNYAHRMLVGGSVEELSQYRYDLNFRFGVDDQNEPDDPVFRADPAYQDMTELRVESLGLRMPSAIRGKHPGASKRLLREYPKEMMRAAIADRAPKLLDFYEEQVS
jgi:hypothetical protein